MVGERGGAGGGGGHSGTEWIVPTDKWLCEKKKNNKKERRNNKKGELQTKT